MKSFQTVSLLVFSTLLAFSLISADATLAAQYGVQFYKIDVDIDEEGRSMVDLVITFRKPEKELTMDVIGRIENFEATSNAGPVECEVDVSGISTIRCDMNLTSTQKELRMSFETMDFVKLLDNKYYYSADFDLGMEIGGVTGTFKLPNGFLLVGENIDSSILSNAENATAHITGGQILIIWNLGELSKTDDLKFEILYEQVKTPPWFNLRMRHFVLFGGAFAVVLGFIFVLYLRRSQTLVLSVLDEYEKQIMSIVTREGEIKQRKIVQMTNLSKAKVSRVIKTLSERGLIEVERVGRTNKIKLVKKKLEI